MLVNRRLLTNAYQMIYFKWRLLRILVILLGVTILLIYLLSIRKDEISSLLHEDQKKIDWNDYELMKNDSLRTGFGEQGKGETLSDLEEIKKNNELFETFGMSVVISDKISVNRSIPDYRHPQCLKRKYFRDLPKVSIIIIFNNEIFSVFKRTLHSLYNRTPHQLVKEVILVNDNSTLEHLYDPLKDYIVENFRDMKFKIINLNKRHGLMKARVIGAKAAESEFLFVMEPHCEMTYNWLPPLIEPLLNKKRVVTVPIIDNVEWKELKYYENDKGNEGSRGVFDWFLEYEKLKRFPIEEDKKLEPFLTPIMTGGIFMIRKDYFFEIGPYDEELLIWGGENLEMSFKINLCGGQLLEVPCSRIGHLFRAFNKFRQHESGIDFQHFNRKRIVEVWFDEFKEFVYRRDRAGFTIDAGDLTKPKKLRDKLKCKPFKYFVDVVAPDLTKKFPYDAEAFAVGSVRLDSENFCLEAQSDPGSVFLLTDCYNPVIPPQDFELSWYRDIRVRKTNLCLDYYKATMGVCHLEGSNQLFKYDIKTKQIKSLANNECLQANVNTRKLIFTKCKENSDLQKWSWSEFANEAMLNNWEKSGRAFVEPEQYYWDD